MNLRPRCREWLPLATHQLRLRNLARIQGLNIEYNDNSNDALIFYSLHHTKEGAAFYTSEPLPQRHLQQKWEEISCAEMLKSNANCVCIKVWVRIEIRYDKNQRHQKDTKCTEEPKELIGALSNKMSNLKVTPSHQLRPTDKLLFTWGVYFSGLILLMHQKDIKWLPNTLIFQMNGAYFASSDHLTTDSLREQLSIKYERYSEIIPKLGMLPADDNCINSPQVSRSSSPVFTDPETDLIGMSKQRYEELMCPRGDIRKSYDLNRLLSIQELQRMHLLKTREGIEMCTEIKRLSVACVTKEQVASKPRTTSLSSSSSHHHSMGRTLSILLAEQHQIDPRVLLRAQELKKKIEIVRSRQRLLIAEQETYSKQVAQLRDRLTLLKEENKVKKLMLDTKNIELEHENKELAEMREQQLMLRQQKLHIMQNMERRMSTLCMELAEIYPIRRTELGNYTICNIPIPNMSSYSMEPHFGGAVSLDYASPTALSAALGYVAHVVRMISVILNRPLRNPIIHEGSRSRVMDVVKDLPIGSQEFPLYSRSSIMQKPVRYAIHLLNQNIAQLCYDITGLQCDPRATVENLLHIFATLSVIDQYGHDKLTTNASNANDENAIVRQHPLNRQQTDSSSRYISDSLAKLLSLNDMNSLVPAIIPSTTTSTTLLEIPSSQPISIATERNNSQRISRSVGSYSDCEDMNGKDINDQRYSNSESNIQQFQDETS